VWYLEALGPGSSAPFQAKREQLKKLYGLLPESQGQNLALTVLYVPHSLDSGHSRWINSSKDLRVSNSVWYILFVLEVLPGPSGVSRVSPTWALCRGTSLIRKCPPP